MNSCSNIKVIFPPTKISIFHVFKIVNSKNHEILEKPQIIKINEIFKNLFIKPKLVTNFEISEIPLKFNKIFIWIIKKGGKITKPSQGKTHHFMQQFYSA